MRYLGEFAILIFISCCFVAVGLQGIMGFRTCSRTIRRMDLEDDILTMKAESFAGKMKKDNVLIPKEEYDDFQEFLKKKNH